VVPLQHAGEVPWVEESTTKPEVIVVSCILRPKNFKVRKLWPNLRT
jgi:hypothetical protein